METKNKTEKYSFWRTNNILYIRRNIDEIIQQHEYSSEEVAILAEKECQENQISAYRLFHRFANEQ